MSNFKNLINKCVVRIIADVVNINWDIPYLKETPQKGQGTGFFIDNKGTILTCAHVIDSAKNIYIEIPNLTSEKYECELIGICPEFDIGMIRCKNYKSKEYLLLGDSDKIKVESNVQVVGYPVSMKKKSHNSNNLKITVGIIGGQQAGLIQTDSAINPGNSGGPLFYKNKVIGINSQKLVGQSLENIGFSIPINYYKIIRKYFNGQKIIYRPSLLFDFNNTTKSLIENLTNKKISHGIIISKIYDMSVLKTTPIETNDIIISINNYNIDNFGLTINFKWLGTAIDTDVLLNRFTNDETINIKYYSIKNKQIQNTNVKLVPFICPIRKIYPALEPIDYFVFGGIIFSMLTENYIYNIKDDRLNINLICFNKELKNKLKSKIIITTIFNNKINILKNISNGDIISKINDIEVETINDLKNALNKPLVINNKKYIKIENSKNKYVIENIDDLLFENNSFSKNYSYNISNIYNKL